MSYNPGWKYGFRTLSLLEVVVQVVLLVTVTSYLHLQFGSFLWRKSVNLVKNKNKNFLGLSSPIIFGVPQNFSY